MNKLLAGICIGIIFGSLGGYFIAKSEIYSTDYVRVKIINSSGKTVNKVVLTHGNGTYEIVNLLDKTDTKIVFKNPGEGTYSLTATLENDSTVLFKEEYIEGGYERTETITAKEIRTTYN
ncbi:hypothetical protein [Cytophaga aurantiaca]|uniref:hypothetical protein n=1 Tax=Cytophaga aurantiaca TaxID=29530 RepID=UPI0003655644|nr:hypothetical protein [Cytophaga aurantiaca]